MPDPGSRPRGLFVTATDTGVGKTYLTALIARDLRARGVRVGAYKPVCSGAQIAADGSASWQDVTTLVEAIGGGDASRVCPLRLKAPLAPPVAARLEEMTVEFGALCAGASWWTGRVDVLLVEGVGGLLCPLTDRETIADFAAAIGYPVLVVARMGLGTINHTLLTIESAQRRGLKVAGVVLNECEPLSDSTGIEHNPAEIARRTNVPLLGSVRWGGDSVDAWPAGSEPVDLRRLVEGSSEVGR